MKKEIAVIDCETDPFKYERVPEPFIWGFYNPKYGFKYFLDKQEFIEFIESKYITIYAHNGGKFDYHFLLDNIEPFEDLLIINSRLSKFRIGLCDCRDSYNILPFPLSHYKKDIFDYSKMEKNEREKHMPEIIHYLENDCRYLYEIVEQFINEYGSNITLASSAMKYWAKMSGVKPPETTQGFYKEISQYYYGGRVECFKAGIFNDNIQLFDINSAYPNAMLFEHAFSTDYHINDKPGDIVNQNFYDITCISKGAFPKKEKNNLKFHNDDETRNYKVTGWELKTALELNLLENVNITKEIIFYDTINFTDYVEYFYNKKSNSEKGTPDYIFSKLFLNSLYGKFGANPDNYDNFEIIPQEYIDAYCTTGANLRGEMGSWALMSKPLTEEEQRYYNVATAASITGFVRAKLLKALNSIENPLYCDTDAIIFTGKHKLEVSDKLGDWSSEGEFFEACIAGKKLYALKGIKKNKMAHKGAKLTYNEIKLIAQGEEIIYKNEAPVFSLIKKPHFIDRKIRKTI